jgi:hypothetical protein
MIELTQEQREALLRNDTEPIRVIDPTTGDEYVLVRAAVYQRLQHLLQDEGPSKREVAILVENAMKEYDENDPGLELYQND